MPIWDFNKGRKERQSVTDEQMKNKYSLAHAPLPVTPGLSTSRDIPYRPGAATEEQPGGTGTFTDEGADFIREGIASEAANAADDAADAAREEELRGSSFMDPQMEEFLRSQFSGPRDTSREEALARKEIEDQTGKALQSSRARSGFAGFGLSGASSALEGDIRTKAADAALAQVLGIRQGARDESFRNGALASQLFNEEAGRQQGQSEAGKDRELTVEEMDLQKRALALALEQMGIDAEEFFNSTPGAPDDNPNNDNGSAFSDWTREVNDSFEDGAIQTDPDAADLSRDDIDTMPDMPTDDAYALRHDYTFLGYAENGSGDLVRLYKSKADGKLYKERN